MASSIQHFDGGVRHGRERQHRDRQEGLRGVQQRGRCDVERHVHDDAQQHVPGKSQFAGDYKGRDKILELYGKLGEASNGTFRAVLEDVKADGADKVVAVYAGQGERDGKKLGTKNTLTFTLKDGKFVDLEDSPDDLAAWDDFWG